MKKFLTIAVLFFTVFANVANAMELCCIDLEHSAAPHSHEISHDNDADDHNDESNNVACDCCACHGHCETKLFSAFNFIDVQVVSDNSKNSLSDTLLISKIPTSLYRPPIA